MDSKERFRLVLALVVMGAAMLITPAPRVWAGDPTDQLRSHIEQVISVLEGSDARSEGGVADRRTAVRRIAGEIFDFSETARRALGRHWAARTPAEHEEFVGAFSDLLDRAYFSKIELYGGEKITYAGDTTAGDAATVHTKIIAKSGSEIAVDYRMMKKSDRWMVYDVVIEGMSLVSNYRAQFDKIIRTSSFEELVKKIKAKQAELPRDRARHEEDASKLPG